MDAVLPILQQYDEYALTALIVTVFATPLAMQLARRFGVMDMPDQNLKPHARPTPYMGGVAICLGWCIAILTAQIYGVVDWHTALPVMLGGVIMSVLGLIDDIFNISPKIRLLVGTAVITAVLLISGNGFWLVDSVLGLFGVTAPAFLAVPLSIAISVFIVLGACNSANLIDGLDGLCTGVTAIISFGFFFLAAFLASVGYSQTGDPVRLVLAIAMFGAAMGFLPWNFNPAKIFMGDAGSTLLGYNCGILIVLFAERGIFRWVIGALMIFALPVFDTALAMFRRWRSGRSIFEGDRSHFYDQLMQRGMTVRQSVLTCYMLATFYVLMGLTVIWVRTRHAIVVFLLICVLTVLATYLTGLTHPEKAGRAKDEPEGD